MTLKSRVSEARTQLPASRLFLLLSLSVAVTWYLVYVRIVDYLVSQGGDPDSIGRLEIAIQAFDAKTMFFGFLVFVIAGIIPITVLLIRANSTRSILAQVLWAATAIGLVMFASLSSH